MRIARRKPQSMPVALHGDIVHKASYVCGALFTWRDTSPGRVPDWVITHAPSGLRVARGLPTMPSAVTCMRMLHKLGDWNFTAAPSVGTQLFDETSRTRIVQTVESFGGKTHLHLGSKRK